jgi:hypothetical protein
MKELALLNQIDLSGLIWLLGGSFAFLYVFSKPLAAYLQRFFSDNQDDQKAGHDSLDRMIHEQKARMRSHGLAPSRTERGGKKTFKELVQTWNCQELKSLIEQIESVKNWDLEQAENLLKEAIKKEFQLKVIPNNLVKSLAKAQDYILSRKIENLNLAQFLFYLLGIHYLSDGQENREGQELQFWLLYKMGKFDGLFKVYRPERGLYLTAFKRLAAKEQGRLITVWCDYVRVKGIEPWSDWAAEREQVKKFFILNAEEIQSIIDTWPGKLTVLSKRFHPDLFPLQWVPKAYQEQWTETIHQQYLLFEKLKEQKQQA